MDIVLDIASTALLITGTFFVFAGGLGVMRMPDFFTRMHAASLTDTGGAALILIGLMLQGGLTLVPLKLAAIFLFLFLTSPTASYALANAALLSGLKPLCRNETGKGLPSAMPAQTKPQPKKQAVKKVARKSPVKQAKKKAGKSSS